MHKYNFIRKSSVKEIPFRINEGGKKKKKKEEVFHRKSKWNVGAAGRTEGNTVGHKGRLGCIEMLKANAANASW